MKARRRIVKARGDRLLKSVRGEEYDLLNHRGRPFSLKDAGRIPLLGVPVTPLCMKEIRAYGRVTAWSAGIGRHKTGVWASSSLFRVIVHETLESKTICY